MDGWGSLTMLIKRQEAAKSRKAVLKHELQKRNGSFLNSGSIQELEFPKISDTDMKILKQQIRKKYRVERVRSIIINILVFIFVLTLFTYFLS